MTIEIACVQCGSKLTVPDEAADAQAKCPFCSAVFDVASANDASQQAQPEGIHLAETAPFGGQQPEGPPPLDEESANPYASPTSIPPPSPSGPQGPIELGRVDAGMALKLAWELFVANLPVLLTTHVTYLLISMFLSIMSLQAQENGAPALAGGIDLAGTVVEWFLGIGLTLITLGVARGQRVEFGSLFAGGPWFARYLLVNLILVAMILIGLVLLIVPGIYLWLRFWPAPYFVVDRNMSVMDSLRAASYHTTGNKGSGILLWLLMLIVLIAGALALCVGFFAAFPVVSLMWTIAYLMMTRQEIRRPV